MYAIIIIYMVFFYIYLCITHQRPSYWPRPWSVEIHVCNNEICIIRPHITYYNPKPIIPHKLMGKCLTLSFSDLVQLRLHNNKQYLCRRLSKKNDVKYVFVESFRVRGIQSLDIDFAFNIYTHHILLCTWNVLIFVINHWNLN